MDEFFNVSRAITMRDPVRFTNDKKKKLVLRHRSIQVYDK